MNVNQLICGLNILKKYQPELVTYPCNRANKTLEVQEAEFINISSEDRAVLLDLGWETNGSLLWLK